MGMKIVEFENGQFAVKKGMQYIGMHGYKWTSLNHVRKYCLMSKERAEDLYKSMQPIRSYRLPKIKVERRNVIIRIPSIKTDVFKNFISWMFSGNFDRY
jgi:hypothetical protein